MEQFLAKVNDYKEQCFTKDKAIHHAGNDDLSYLHKRLRQEYTQFQIEFYKLQKDCVQQ